MLQECYGRVMVVLVYQNKESYGSTMLSCLGGVTSRNWQDSSQAILDFLEVIGMCWDKDEVQLEDFVAAVCKTPF